jgi:Xaa-Pro aminopeptidase
MRPSAKTLLAAARVPAFLITNEVNIRYLTGFSHTDGLLLALPKGYVFYLNPLIDAYVKDELAYKDIAIKPSRALAIDMRRHPVCGFEEEDVSAGRMRRWKKQFPRTRFVPAGQVIEECRRQKNDDELKAIRRALKITREIFRRIPSALRRATTEKALAAKIEQWARELGAEEMAFPPIVAFGTHTARPHHHPTGRKLKKGHVVLIDAGVSCDGYKSDMTRTYFTSQPTPEQARAYEAVVEAKMAAEALLKPGVLNIDLDKAARAVLGKYGLNEYFEYALGHGVGLEVHEGIRLSGRSAPQAVLQREVLAIEAGVHFPGKFGIRVEDTLIVA